MPANAFSAPAACCTVTVPIRLPLLTRERPSAMFSATRSCRATIGRMPAAEMASRIGVKGNRNTCSMPSRLRISATAWSTRMGVSFSVWDLNSLC